MHSLSLQWTSSKSEPLQAKDSTTSDPGWTGQGRLKGGLTATLLTCARQNIALRGHRAEDESFVGCSEPAENDGNFRALLRYRMRGGDVALCTHLTGAGSCQRYVPVGDDPERITRRRCSPDSGKNTAANSSGRLLGTDCRRNHGSAKTRTTGFSNMVSDSR